MYTNGIWQLSTTSSVSIQIQVKEKVYSEMKIKSKPNDETIHTPQSLFEAGIGSAASKQKQQANLWEPINLSFSLES